MPAASGSKKASHCPLCKREFGIFLHRYTCGRCEGTFCDDCTPNKYVVSAEAGAESVCKTCEQALIARGVTQDGGRRLDGHVATSTGSSTASGGTSRPAPDDESEREKRARIAEERVRATARTTTSSQQPKRSEANALAPVRCPPAAASPPAEVATEDRTQNPVVTSSTAPSSAPLDRPDQPVNPVLAAALRRQEQQLRPGSNMPANDPEKQRLLNEIVHLLKMRREDEPFGLRAMDATKLRMYLQHLKPK